MLSMRKLILACFFAISIFCFNGLSVFADDAEDAKAPAVFDLNKQLNELDESSEKEKTGDPGQALLDEAILAKMSLEKLADADTVINSCKSAISKGLSESNQIMANDLIRSTYIQRGTILTENIQNGAFTDQNQMKIVVDLALSDMSHVFEYLPKDSNKETFEGAGITWYNIAFLKLLKNKKDNEGMEALKTAKRLCVNVPNLYAKVLTLEVQTIDDPEQQIKLLREAVKLDEESVTAHRLLAQVLVALKRPEEALKNLQVVMEEEKDNPVDLLLLAGIMEDLKRPREALEPIQKLRALAPKSDKLKLMELRLAVNLRDDDLVLKSSNDILKSKPEDETLLLLRAAIFAQRKQYDKALQEIQQLLFFDENNVRGLELKLEILFRTGKKDEAWTIAQSLIKTMSEDPKTDSVSAWALFDLLKSMGKKEEALAFAKIVATRSDDDEFKYQIALASDLLGNDKKSEAAALAQTLLKQDLKESYKLGVIAILVQAEDYDSALKAYQEGAKKNEKDPEMAQLFVFGEAETLVKQGKKEAALAIIDPKVENPDASNELLKLSISFYRSCKESKKVVAVLDRLIAKNPDEFGYRELLSYALMDIGDYKRVNENFQKLIDLSDNKEQGYNNYSWFLCTYPDEKARNGQKALELAKKAAELSNYKEAYILSTLAAAYAETGNFDEALKWIQKGLDESKSDSIRNNLKKEKESYEAKKPWREKGGFDQLDQTDEG